MEEQKQWWTFTFGCGQQYAGKCVKIYGTYGQARQTMFDRYGEDWAFQYSEEKWKKDLEDPHRYWPMEETLEEIKCESE